MATYFTSDTHFGHANIIKYCNRPFASVEEMDETMIQRWNEVVKPGDTVWHLGDFSFHNGKAQIKSIMDRLNGNKCIVWGNHDIRGLHHDVGWDFNYDIANITLDGTHLVLCHYAMRVWSRDYHGSLMLYGHSHNCLPPIHNSLDVGVDCWDFRPVTLSQIKKRLQFVGVADELL